MALFTELPVYPVGCLSNGVNRRMFNQRGEPRRILNLKDMYFYVYVLLSEKDGNFYTGYTDNIQARIKLHYNGKVISTKNRRPLKLIYWEGCLNQQDATRREKYLKSGNGKIYLKNRIRNYFQSESNPTG